MYNETEKKRTTGQEHTEPSFQDLKMLTSRKLVSHRIAMLTFKNFIVIAPTSVTLLFTRND